MQITLRHSGKDYLLSVVIGGADIVKDKLCTLSELISEQLTIMRFVESEISRLSNSPTSDIQELSYALPTSIMSELKRLK
jgi:hypothetical protein